MQDRLRRAHVFFHKANGYYGRSTVDAVAQFQVWYGVRGDPRGVYGPNTRAALERSFP
jgi:peptidoglycan hydrolase-like protein with peptidoglycan-binding domain